MNTVFGQCIIGKISGSTWLTDAKTVTPLSIVHVVNVRDGLHHPGLLSTDEDLDSFNGNQIIS